VKFIKLPFHALHLKRISKKENIKFVLSVLNRANYVNIITKLLGCKHKCLISERNTPSYVYSSYTLTDIINRFLIRKLYPNSDKIIAISEGVKTDLITNFNIPEKLIDVIYNPIDIDAIKKQSEEKIEHRWLNDESLKTIISVGRLEKQKNHTLLIRSFQEVRSRLPDTRLIILGEGNERKNLHQLLSDLKLESYVELPGVFDNPFAYLSKANVFVLSSDFEGFGNVIIEAMACNCPVISTDCPSGPNEIISNNENGILVPVGDRDKLSNAIISLLRNKPYRELLANNAQKRVRDFNLDNIMLKYEQSLI
jgi:N-acetylgalactosamine-N,N'-diacetylbacillosaminyl-diphospho-undecaprenol 4-alpha-N-acetylgalactosaminyltransferase